MFALSWFLACFSVGGGQTSADTAATATNPGTAAIAPGDLVITEIMPDPLAVDGDFGEYVELTSVASNTLDLAGVSFADSDGDGFTVSGPLPLAPGGRLVFAPSADAAVNGGLTVDFAYDITGFKLQDSDAVVLSLGTTVIDTVVFEEDAWGLVEGYSLQLSPNHTDATSNDAPENWCNSTTTFGDGDRGTPGSANTPC